MAFSDRSLRGALVAISASVMSMVACRQLVGITTDPPHDPARDDAAAGDAVPACGPVIPNAACASCANAQCCQALADCSAEPGCASYETCALACEGDPACRSKCLDDNPTGAAIAMAALDACLGASCASECAIRCGGSSPVTPPTAASSCAACVESKSCSARAGCVQDLPCGALTYCYAGCFTHDCRTACDDAHEAGVAGYDKASAALLPCATECAVGNDWQCVDRVAWSPAKGDVTAISYRVTSFGNAVRGATVTLCSVLVPSCTNGLTGTTAVDGTASISLSQVQGAVGPLVFFEIASPALFPTIDYWPSPFSEARARIGLDVPDPSAMARWAQDLGVALDPARGHIGVETRDCQLNTTPGATYAFEAAPGVIDEASVGGYFSNDVLTSSVQETDRRGLGGLLNVNPGNLTITVTPKRLGRPSSRMTVTVRAGMLTHVTAQPLPP